MQREYEVGIPALACFFLVSIVIRLCSIPLRFTAFGLVLAPWDLALWS